MSIVCLSFFFALTFGYSEYTFEVSYYASLVIDVVAAEVTIKYKGALLITMLGPQVQTRSVPRDCVLLCSLSLSLYDFFF